MDLQSYAEICKPAIMEVEAWESLVSSLIRSWCLVDRFLRITHFVECSRPLIRYMLLNFILVKLCTHMVFQRQLLTLCSECIF